MSLLQPWLPTEGGLLAPAVEARASEIQGPWGQSLLLTALPVTRREPLKSWEQWRHDFPQSLPLCIGNHTVSAAY